MSLLKIVVISHEVTMPPKGASRKTQHRVQHQRSALPLRDGSLRLVLVADTHSRPHPRSDELIRAQRPDAIAHAGDIGDLAVLDGLRAIAPLFAVRGNIDAHAASLPDALTLELTSDERAVFTALLVHIAVYGPKLRADVGRLARTEGAQVVLCGHSHVPFIGRDQGLVLFNPGSIGPRRFQLPIVFGVIDVKPAGVSMFHVSCETGERWLP